MDKEQQSCTHCKKPLNQTSGIITHTICQHTLCLECYTFYAMNRFRMPICPVCNIELIKKAV